LKIGLCALLLLAVLAAGAPASSSRQRQSLTVAQINSIGAFVTTEMARTHVPGVAVGIYSRGKILLEKGYGLSNVELEVPVKPQTMFQSGSVGKQFVAAAIMMLVERHRISLDDSIAKYFPGAPATWRPIRIENLLSHTSGLAEYETDALTGPRGPFYLRLDYTEDQLLKKIEALPIENAPGAKWNYRNTNYVLLGFLIHRVTGMFYADYLAKCIFRPLGMASTRLIGESAIVPNRAAGYQWEDGALKNQDWVSPTFDSTADGSLYFNVVDLAKWDAALYTTRLLGRSSLNRMWTVYDLNDGEPNPANYGFAWRIDRQNGHRVLEHSGAWQGFTCNISRFPDDSLTVVVLTNLDAARPWYMSQVIAGLADPALMPKRLAAIPDTRPNIAASLRSLLNAVAAGTDVRKLVAPDVAETLTSQDAAYTRRLVQSFWPGGSLTLVEREHSGDVGSLVLSQYRLAKAGRTMLVTYGLNSSGQAEALFFEPDKEYQSRDV
jgi:CubicO group peptidase (beta-lactamase class C family)